jgi:hypothetical protein
MVPLTDERGAKHLSRYGYYRPSFLISNLNYPLGIYIHELSFGLDKSSYAFFLCKLADNGQEIVHGCVLRLKVNNKP